MRTAPKDVAAKLELRLKDISVANGYSTDIGQTVFAGKLLVDREDAPCITIIEGSDTVSSSSRKEAVVTQTYVFAGFMVCDPNRPNDAAHLMMEDIKQAIFGPDAKSRTALDDLVKTVKYKGRNIGPREPGSDIATAEVSIEVEFVDSLVMREV